MTNFENRCTMMDPPKGPHRKRRTAANDAPECYFSRCFGSPHGGPCESIIPRVIRSSVVDGTATYAVASLDLLEIAQGNSRVGGRAENVAPVLVEKVRDVT